MSAEREQERQDDVDRQLEQREPERDAQRLPGLRVAEQRAASCSSPTNRSGSSWSRLMLVNVNASDAIIGASVNTKKPMSQGDDEDVAPARLAAGERRQPERRARRAAAAAGAAGGSGGARGRSVRGRPRQGVRPERRVPPIAGGSVIRSGRASGLLVPDRLDLGAQGLELRVHVEALSVCQRVCTCRPSRRVRGSRCRRA